MNAQLLAHRLIKHAQETRNERFHAIVVWVGELDGWWRDMSEHRERYAQTVETALLEAPTPADAAALTAFWSSLQAVFALSDLGTVNTPADRRLKALLAEMNLSWSFGVLQAAHAWQTSDEELIRLGHVLGDAAWTETEVKRARKRIGHGCENPGSTSPRLNR